MKNSLAERERARTRSTNARKGKAVSLKSPFFHQQGHLLLYTLPRAVFDTPAPFSRDSIHTSGTSTHHARLRLEHSEYHSPKLCRSLPSDCTKSTLPSLTPHTSHTSASIRHMAKPSPKGKREKEKRERLEKYSDPQRKEKGKNAIME